MYSAYLVLYIVQETYFLVQGIVKAFIKLLGGTDSGYTLVSIKTL
jgi:hypothetical protein